MTRLSPTVRVLASLGRTRKSVKGRDITAGSIPSRSPDTGHRVGRQGKAVGFRTSGGFAVCVFDGPRRRGATSGHSRTKSPKAKNHATDDDCTNERPNKYFEPSAAFNHVAKKVASKGAKHSADYSRNL
jgi:hypothetical protein